MEYETYALGDFTLESELILHSAEIAYATWGRLAADGGNAILLPSFITGTHEGYHPFIGADSAFDPERYFIVATNLFGNGLSTSPSNAAAGQRGPDFPAITIRDNVRAQQILLSHLGVERLAMAAGFSMGAQQALQWAVSFPERVARVAAWCGTPQSTAHTVTVFNAMRAVLHHAPDFADGHYSQPPVEALKTMANVYAPWGLSQDWYRREGWTGFGFETLSSFIAGFWESTMAAIEANDFLAQMTTLQGNDLAAGPEFGGDLTAALASIRARVLLMPGSTDLYFPAIEAEQAAALIPQAIYQPIQSDWGHFAGIGIDADSTAQIAAAVRQLLSEPATDHPA